MLRVNVNLVTATMTETETLTSGRVGLECGFAFSSEWDGLTKVATFEGAETADVAMFDSDTVTVPAECLSSPGVKLRIGVCGMNAAGDIVIPTIWALAGRVQRGAEPSGIPAAEPAPSWSAQVQSAAANALEIARGVATAAENGEFDGADGISPTANVVKNDHVATFTVTDRNGTTSIEIMDGQQGERGITGDTGPAGPAGPQGPKGDPDTDAVLVQDTQPTAESNKLWVLTDDGGETELVPTYAEFKEVANNFTDASLTAWSHVGLINASNKWTASSGTSHICIPLRGAKEIEIVSGSRQTSYAFLASYNYAVGTVADYAEGTGKSSLASGGNKLIMQIPDDAAYLYCMNESASMNYLPSAIYLDGVDVTKTVYQMLAEHETSITALDVYNYGLEALYPELEKPNRLSASLVYEAVGTHVAIPVVNAKHLTVRAGNATAMAFLAETNEGVGNSPVYCPSSDPQRYALLVGFNYAFDVPEGCNYVYFHCSTSTAPGRLLPQYLEIDGHVLIDKTELPTHTVFFDDFDGDTLSGRWKKIQNSVEAMQHYFSRFYTDDDDCYVSDGCLVLRCMKDGELDLGHTNLNVNGETVTTLIERLYKAAYISTQDKFAIKRGSISAKIKLSHDISHGYPFTFFTFSQGNLHPYAPEFDIIEGLATFTTEQREVNGTVYPAGSRIGSVVSHVHYMKQGTDEPYDNDSETRTNAEIYYEDNCEYSMDDTYHATDWHVYRVTWDEEQIELSIDGRTIKLITAQTDDLSDFATPADIRLNVKARTWCDQSIDYAMFVDWVKVESFDDIVPVTGIGHENITMAVGDNLYIRDVIKPSNATNQAFEMETSNASVVYIYQKIPEYEAVYHRLEALQAGTATITLTTPDGHHTSTFTVTVT